MTTVITRLFDTADHATQAVRELEAGGVSHDNISIVASNSDNRYGSEYTATTTGTTTAGTTTTGPTLSSTAATDSTAMTDGTVSDDTSTGAGTGATIGTLIGGGAGLLAGLGMLAIPGVGPVVAAGWLVATALGAGVGAAGGGLLGSLVGAGVSEEDANVYTEGVRRGGTLVTVRADDNQAAMVEQVMAKYNAVDATTRGQEYRAEGWSRFDDTAPAYVAGGPGTMGTMPVGAAGVGVMPGATTSTGPFSDGVTNDTKRRL